MDKTLYLSDLDGTLLNKNAELSQYTKNTLTRMIADGLCFSVATARTAETAFKILDGVKWNVPVILMNGVLIYDTQNKRYAQVLSMNPETVEAVLSVFKQYGVTGLMYQLLDNKQTTYYESLEHKPIRDFMDERTVRYNKVFNQVDSFFEVKPESIIYFTQLDKQERLQPVYNALLKLQGISSVMYRDIYSTDLWYLEIFNNNASKHNASVYLRDAFKFDRIIGFGDNLNDLPLFEASDTKVAVENAHPDVKASADFVCGPNGDDGVVKWIEASLRGLIGE